MHPDHNARPVLAKLVRLYVQHGRAPEGTAYVDLGARMDWRESGHYTAARGEPDRYLLSRPRPSTVGDSIEYYPDLLPVEAPDDHHRPLNDNQAGEW